MEQPKAKATVSAPTQPARRELAAAVFAVLGTWSIAVPYVAPALGLSLTIRPGVEFADHVVPGLVVVAAGAALAVLLRNRRSPPEGLRVAAMISMAFLAGFWMLSTHLPLLIQASRGLAPWGAATFHTAPGAMLVIPSLWLLIAELRDG